MYSLSNTWRGIGRGYNKGIDHNKMKAKNTPISKVLRLNQTPWEAKLWKFLRGKKLWEYKFKRQVPIENYIVDFCCQSKRLIIEIDGGGHNELSAKTKDLKRDFRLTSLGYKILRFWNNEIDNNIAGVLEVIDKNISSTSPPTLPNTWGGRLK